MDYRQSVERSFLTTFARVDNRILVFVGNKNLKRSSAEELGGYQAHDAIAPNVIGLHDVCTIFLCLLVFVSILRSSNYPPLVR